MKNRKIFAVALLIFTVLLTSFSFYAYQVVYTPNILVDKSDQYLKLPSGVTFEHLQDSLYEKDYVQDLVSFSFLARILGYDELIKPGRYKLEKNMSNLSALQLLIKGEQTPVNVTFNNIRLKDELAQKICRNLEADEEYFLNLINTPSVAKEYGFDTTTIMTMFIPNTYELYWTTNARELLARMHREYENFWNETRKAKADSIGLSQVEVSILASIVMAESTKIDEAGKIAGVYMNRLERGMPLQADPTLIFAMKDFTIKRVLNKHKEIESPYNTYKNRGLPPGPIKLPSISAIDAVLNYEPHKYLYMCAKPDFSGYHNFAQNLSTHNRNARRYQQALDEAGF